jgi:hypothetical protein
MESFFTFKESQPSFSRSTFLAFFMSLFFIYNGSQASTFSLQSTDKKVNILEVYTSQGCSSCPPAEHWLTKFENDPRLWKQFIPINFHVDYWDYIGWKDPLADPKFSSRQRLYEHLELSRNVATPGFILNGKGWNGWFYGQEPTLVTEKSDGVITAQIIDDYINVRFSPISASSSRNILSEPLSVHVAILGFDVKTKVSGGENNGRELEHDFVVLAYNAQDLFKGEGKAESRMTLPNTSKYQDTKKAIVVWVSKRNNPIPIQAVGDWL